MTSIFTLITPFTYWVLIALWSFILYFYIKKMSGSRNKQLFVTLVMILALDAFRTLFESIYFGALRSAQAGFISSRVESLLIRPEMLFVPKLLNVCVAMIIITLLLRYWIPKEEKEIMWKEEALKESEQSRILMKNLIDNIPGMVYRAGANWSAKIANDSTRICGYSPQEINAMEHKWISLIHPDDKDAVIERGKSLAEQKTKSLVDTYRIIHKDGQVRWVEDHKGLLLSSEGELLGIDGVVFDITERKQAERKLLASEKRMALHVEKIPLAVIEWDTEFKVRKWNPAAERIFGYNSQEALGKDAKFIIPKEFEEGLDAIWLGLKSQEGGFRSRNENIRKDGKRITCEWHNTPIVDNDGRFMGFTSLTEDITKSIEIEKTLSEHREHLEELVVERTKELEQSQEQLFQAEKLASIGQLSSGVAHELNSPLAGLISLIRSYKKEKDQDSSEYQDLEDMEAASEYMAKIVKDLNMFSRTSVGELEECDCNEIIESTLSFGSYPFKSKRIKILKKYAKDLHPLLLDKNQAQQVVLNILTNAAQAMDIGGVLTIETSNRQSKEGLLVAMSFEDNGAGILKENLKKIFDPFFTTKRPGKGVGLGLSIVFNIVQNHGGKILVESELKKGTKIIVEWPAKK